MASPQAAKAGLAMALALASGLASCGGAPGESGPPRRSVDAPRGGAGLSALHAGDLRGLDDPAARAARIVPVNLDEARTWGVEPGGGLREVVAGLRLVAWPAGAVVSAEDRLPASPSAVVELPDRLGGGFAMAVGTHLWRAPTWLGLAAPVYTLTGNISDIVVGLDRLYLRASQGPLVALDPRSGASLDLGPLPPSPRVVSAASLDAWRGVAVADLRGVLLTLDAGSSWRAVRLPIEPARAIAAGDAFAVGGWDASRTMQWWEVLPDGQVGWLATGASPPAATPPPARAPTGTGLFDHALQAAVEDGWPLVDGSALLARDGFLARVRLSDGSVLEVAPDAFPLSPARCQAIGLARPEDRGAFGFVCGEAHGRTGVYRWDPAGSRLVELRRFETPRAVLGSGNGAIAVRGPCDARGAPSDGAEFCVMTPSGTWSDLRAPSIGAGDGTRVVVLSTGRAALIRPPQGGDLATARLSLTRGLTDDAGATEVPLRIAPAAPDVVRALRLGVWMDGFEERRAGVLSGWIDAAGSVLGVEIAVDGEVRVGESIRDAGAPLASGRWAFGWTASGGGFETTDGGMLWTKEIALPPPINEPRAGRDRSCGPVGCVLAGWIRVGWGVVAPPSPPDPPPPRVKLSHRAPNLALACAPAASGVPLEPYGALPAVLSSVAPRSSGRGAIPSAATAFRPFAGRSPAPTPAGDVGFSIDASYVLDRGTRARSVGRIYGWGPTGDWDTGGRWQVLWSWPWQSGAPADYETRASAPGPAPWASLEVVTRTLGNGFGLPPEWSVVPGDDADHALLLERRPTLGGSGNSGTMMMLATLETDRAPLEVHPPGSEPWPDLQGAVRAGGRWYVATSQGSGETAATVVWMIDGAAAREAGRVPRVAPELAGPARLARRVGGAGASDAVGLLVVGPDADGAERGSSLWVTTLDPEGHAFSEPELLAPADLSDRTLAPCTGDDAGWEVEATFPGTLELRASDASSRSRLQGNFARLRIGRKTACIDDAFGSGELGDARAAHAGPIDGAGTAGAGPLALAPAAPGVRTIPVTLLGDHLRMRLRCRVAP
ncbi:MAG TPA: hypothetical protein VHV30_12850 [Polyangiaceae bacterium]|jgi:hypothetical protein|nr:hypothetical protein [Polyangiaceae bacterium]